ncbi:unnamed protein product [Amoebophrya sp. A25]|nr:unnamed protein product [Amoebophrya sp. A25]|eukprot:GSA25T00000363001.1
MNKPKLHYANSALNQTAPDRYYHSWSQFGTWVRKLLHFRRLQPFHRDFAGFKSGEGTKQCHSSEVGTYSCVNFAFEFDASDIFHIRPVEDMLRDTRFASVYSWREMFGEGQTTSAVEKGVDQAATSSGREGQVNQREVFVLHLETMKEDLTKLYDRVCDLYGRYCRRGVSRKSGVSQEIKGNAPSSALETEEADFHESFARHEMTASATLEGQQHELQYEKTSSDSEDDDDAYRFFVEDDAGEQMEVTSDYVGDPRSDFGTDTFPKTRARATFPKVYPTTNRRPQGKNACDLDLKRLQFSADCLTTWADLWNKDPELVEMVRHHYAVDFALFGYGADWNDIFPTARNYQDNVRAAYSILVEREALEGSDVVQLPES